MKVKWLNFTKPEPSLCFAVESGKHLLKMGKGGVIERVISAVSAAPIVVLCRKGNEDVCVCGDFSVTHSARADVETYPRPQIEDMHSALTGQISTKTGQIFHQKVVTYLGHEIDGEGLHPTEDQFAAICDAPRPKDVTALKSFLGLIMF